MLWIMDSIGSTGQWPVLFFVDLLLCWCAVLCLEFVQQ